ncbi:hypothetical protein H9W95_13635 [Flavobacterium lindanitolerans]|nr:hypothetical protein [Flavobacterium lindanitolerans]
MKILNICLWLLFIGFSFNSFAQTGINTKNPWGTLHVDPAKTLLLPEQLQRNKLMILLLMTIQEM